MAVRLHRRGKGAIGLPTDQNFELTGAAPTQLTDFQHQCFRRSGWHIIDTRYGRPGLAGFGQIKGGILGLIRRVDQIRRMGITTPTETEATSD